MSFNNSPYVKVQTRLLRELQSKKVSLESRGLFLHLAISLKTYGSDISVSQDVLARDLGCSKRVISRSLKELLEKSVLEALKVPGKRSIYRLCYAFMGKVEGNISTTVVPPTSTGVVLPHGHVNNSPLERIRKTNKPQQVPSAQRVVVHLENLEFKENSPFKQVNENQLTQLRKKYGDRTVQKKINLLEVEYVDASKIQTPAALLSSALRNDFQPSTTQIKRSSETLGRDRDAHREWERAEAEEIKKRKENEYEDYETSEGGIGSIVEAQKEATTRLLARVGAVIAERYNDQQKEELRQQAKGFLGSFAESVDDVKLLFTGFKVTNEKLVEEMYNKELKNIEHKGQASDAMC